MSFFYVIYEFWFVHYTFGLPDMVLIYTVGQKRNNFIEPDRNEHSFEDANKH